MNINLNRKSLPVLYRCDAVILGGSFAGVSAALHLAKKGKKVALIEPRTYLGREMTATLRPWIRAGRKTWPEAIVACLEASGVEQEADEYPLRLDTVKLILEDLLLNAGVKIIYASLPVGLCVENNGIHGVIIGNKSGRQVVGCQLILDTTETNLAVRLAGATTPRVFTKTERCAFTLEMDEAGEVENPIPVPASLGLVNDQVVIHPGYRGKGHVLLEMELELSSFGDSALELTRLELTARQQAIRVAEYLLSQVQGIRGSHLATLSYETNLIHSTPQIGTETEWIAPFQQIPVQVDQKTSLCLRDFAGPYAGMWYLNNATHAGERMKKVVDNPVSTCTLAGNLAEALVLNWERTAARVVDVPLSPSPTNFEKTSDYVVVELKQPQRGREYRQCEVHAMEVPVVSSAEVLVVGGGSSGAMAAIAAAQEGRRTCLVEMNPGLGGTGTYGGVDSYWCGNRAGFVAQSVAWMDQAHAALNQAKPDDLLWPNWNIEARTQAWINAAQTAGVELLCNALVIGAILREKRVCGVIAATRVGPVALLGEVVIDATGDGDVAASVGAEYTYGSARDHMVMWYSLQQVGKPGRTMGNFTSTVDVSNIEDYTRAILSGRRRHGNLKEGCHDHGLYLATRENRHIQGDAELTLNDHLLQRCWPDVVYIAFSNNDIKGQISSDWLRAGLIPPHLEVEIPYRTLLPRGLEGILVVGKALSSSRESLSTIRMQPDFENLGGVVGVAAALAVKSGKTPRQVHIRELQARLTQLGVLPPYILERKLLKFELNEADLIDKIASLRLDQPLHAYSYMELHEVSRQRIPVVDICCAGPQAVTALETALDQEPGGGRRVLIAQMLALLGSQSGVPVLIEAIQRQLADGKLPERDQVIRQVCEYAPDQAAMPDVAYLIYCLGMARDTRALPVWQRIVDLLANTTEEDVTSQPKGIFHYVDAICTGAERLGDPAAIPLLRQLYSYAPFHHQELLNGFQPDYLKERVAYLEVVIGRAMARCSDPQGMVVLINYLNDVRGILAEQAYTEITAISGQDFGRDVARWSHWLEEHGDKLSPVPWVAALEPTKAWKEEILIAPPDEAVIQRVLIYRYKIRGD